jgi:hypothetical protein
MSGMVTCKLTRGQLQIFFVNYARASVSDSIVTYESWAELQVAPGGGGDGHRSGSGRRAAISRFATTFRSHLQFHPHAQDDVIDFTVNNLLV